MEFGERYRQIDLFRLASFFTFKPICNVAIIKTKGVTLPFSPLLLSFTPCSYYFSFLFLRQSDFKPSASKKKAFWLFSTKTGANFVRFVSGIVGTEFTLF